MNVKALEADGDQLGGDDASVSWAVNGAGSAPDEKVKNDLLTAMASYSSAAGQLHQLTAMGNETSYDIQSEMAGVNASLAGANGFLKDAQQPAQADTAGQ